MNIENQKRFYIDFNTIKMIYPFEVSKKVTHFGVLEPYRDQKYTLKEINAIIADLIQKTPYIEGSMRIHMSVKNGMGYHYILDINNYRYDEQKRSEQKEIQFLYEN